MIRWRFDLLHRDQLTPVPTHRLSSFCSVPDDVSGPCSRQGGRARGQGASRLARRLRCDPSMSRSRRVAPPKALEVRRLGSDDEFVLLSWPVPLEAPVGDQLTPAEREVLALVVTGASNAQVARKRGTSVRTVANQMSRLLAKLHAGSRYELVRRFGGANAKP